MLHQHIPTRKDIDGLHLTLETIALKRYLLAIALVAAVSLTACSAEGKTEIVTGVLVGTSENGFCNYQLPDGSISEIDFGRNAQCPPYAQDEIDVEDGE